MARGEDVDWSAGTPKVGPSVTGSPASGSDADDLVHHWHGQPEDQTAQADWQSAELGVHTWDLVQRPGALRAQLDDEVAERGPGLHAAGDDGREPR